MESMCQTLTRLFPKKNGISLGDNGNTSGIRGLVEQEPQQQVEGGGKAEKFPVCRQDQSKPSNKQHQS